MVETFEEIPRTAPGSRDACTAIRAMIDYPSREALFDGRDASISTSLIRASVAGHVPGRPRSC